MMFEEIDEIVEHTQGAELMISDFDKENSPVKSNRLWQFKIPKKTQAVREHDVVLKERFHRTPVFQSMKLDALRSYPITEEVKLMAEGKNLESIKEIIPHCNTKSECYHTVLSQCVDLEQYTQMAPLEGTDLKDIFIRVEDHSVVYFIASVSILSTLYVLHVCSCG